MIRVKIADVQDVQGVPCVIESDHVAVIRDCTTYQVTHTIDVWLTDDDGVPIAYDAPSNIEECLCDAVIYSADLLVERLSWLSEGTYVIKPLLFIDLDDVPCMQIISVEEAPKCRIS